MKFVHGALSIAAIGMFSFASLTFAQQSGEESQSNKSTKSTANSNPENPNQQKQADSKKGNETANRPSGKSAAQHDTSKQDRQEAPKLVLESYELKNISSAALQTALREIGLMNVQNQYAAAYRGRIGRTNGRSSEENSLYIASANNSDLVFIRGSQEDVDQAMQTIKYLESDSNSDPLKVKGATLIPVKHEHISSLKSVMQQLGLRCNVTSVGKSGFVVLDETDDSDSEQIKMVVSKLSQSLDAQNKKGRQKGEEAKKEKQSKETASSEASP